MPEHKMIVIDGIRVRPEDIDRFHPQTPARADASAQAGTPAGTQAPAPAGPLDPAAQGVTGEQVLTYLGTVGEAEALRVLDAEAAGKNRAGVVGKREQLLAAARDRDAAGADDGPAT